MYKGGSRKFGILSLKCNIYAYKKTDMILRKRLMFVLVPLFLLACEKEGTPENPSEETEKPDETEQPEGKTFKNPLLEKGADPWVTQKDGVYYVMFTHGSKLVLRATEKMSEIDKANPVDAWVPPPGTAYSSNIWAPELHQINGKWYIYFAADDGNNANHRMYVLENSSERPDRGSWELKGKIADGSDEWAIDGTVLEYNDKLFKVWSGGKAGSAPQNLYIAKMSNPWTIEGEGVVISTPSYSWEEHGAAINEGPQILKNEKGEVFIVYSASGFWSDNYCLGLLSLKEGGDPLDSSNWEKTPNPVFSKSSASGAYGPGHQGFFKSPDGTEDWIIYHARELPNGGDTNYRNPRMQKFKWNEDGSPDFGVPVKIGEEIEVPSGE